MNYDFSRFHPDCEGKQVIVAPDGVHIVCLECGISANMEAVSAKVSPADVAVPGKVDRTPIGKQSFSLDRGGIQ